ncbi:hypothetical protein ACVPOR_16315 [Staphylococcus aureus]
MAKHVADTMPVIQQVFIDIRAWRSVEKRLFLARTIRVLFDSVRILELCFYELITQNNIKVGYDRPN